MKPLKSKTSVFFSRVFFNKKPAIKLAKNVWIHDRVYSVEIPFKSSIKNVYVIAKDKDEVTAYIKDYFAGTSDNKFSNDLIHTVFYQYITRISYIIYEN